MNRSQLILVLMFSFGTPNADFIKVRYLGHPDGPLLDGMSGE